MKLTDFALIFMGVTFPIIIMVYVNISFTIKAEEQEIYFQKIINIAVQDAASQMKEVENQDSSIDYGYSGTEDKKVSVNSQIAVDTFLDSLYNNFGINGNETAEHYLGLFIPAIAIIDYDGLQVSSIEKFIEGGKQVQKHALKPKRYYSYTYGITNIGTIIDGDSLATAGNLRSLHTVDFTMDDYLIHRGCVIGSTNYVTKGFYIDDATNATDLSGSNNKDLYDNNAALRDTVTKMLQKKRKETIVNTVIKEMGYAINSNNSYAKSAGIEYSFTFPPITTEELNNSVENIGILAFVQGLSVGNRYLNAKAYGLSKLELATRFYLTVPNSGSSKYNVNLYHKDENCPEYNAANKNGIAPRYTVTKQQAAAARVTYKDLSNNIFDAE